MDPSHQGQEDLCTAPHLEYTDAPKRESCRKIAHFAILTWLYTLGSALFRSTRQLGASHSADWRPRSRQRMESVGMRENVKEWLWPEPATYSWDSCQSFPLGFIWWSSQTWQTLSHVPTRKMLQPGSIQSNFGGNLLGRTMGFQYLFPSPCFHWWPVTRLRHF